MPLIIADRVKENSTTTGTGALTLSGAGVGFRAFSDVCAVGDTAYYALQGVDGVGQPSGEWECGLGTYSGANTLTRTTVTSSSNAGAAVVLSAGTKQVYISVPAVQAAWPREKLTAARTYYVATTGSNSNNGLTVGAPFLTIQKAVDVASLLDLGSVNVTIQVADGTYTAGITDFVMPTGSGNVTVLGNVTTPANCVISLAAGACITASGYSQARRSISGFKLISTTSGTGIAARDGAFMTFSNMDFGVCGSYHLTTSNGSILSASGNYAISGSAAVHAFVEFSSIVNLHTRTVTFSNTLSFSSGFVISRQTSMLSAYGMTFAGTSASVTGARYEVQTNAVCFVNGAGASYFPGSVAGSTATGGQYA